MTGTPRRTLGGAFCVSAIVLAAPFAGVGAQGADGGIVARDVTIGMRVGAPLHARVYRPAGRELRPAILSLEADTTEARTREARALAAAGYAVVIAAPRGGDDRHVGRDGYDAVEWIGDQPWSDRRVVMSGTGEGANAAWNAARERPPHLASIVARAPSRALGWTDTELGRVVVSSLSIAGSAGDEQGTAIDTHARYAAAVRQGGAPLAYLVIGTLAAPDLALLERQWFDWAIGGGPLPALLRNRVNYLALDDGNWHSAASLAAVGAIPTGFPLHTNAGPHAAPGGFLGEEARDDEPADTVTAGEKTYETLLGRPLELAGRPAVTLWLDDEPPPVAFVPHRVRVLSLDEVRADGSTVPLGRSAGRREFTDSTSAPGHARSRWAFTSFPWIALRLAAGSRLRLTVNGERTVIWHDIERYSRVVLPVTKSP